MKSLEQSGKVRAPEVTRRKLLDAAIVLMRRQGFGATSVGDICEQAGVTKGAFFHHFSSKEELSVAALQEWCRQRVEGYRRDIGQGGGDPLAQLNRMIDGLIASLRNPPDGILSCLLGMVSQEVALVRQGVRESCCAALGGWTNFVAGLLRAAKAVHPIRTDFNPEQVGWMLNSLWQGSLLVAKTRNEPEIAVNNLKHAKNYIDSLFLRNPTEKPGT